MRFLLAIPAYNCEIQIPRTLSRLANSSINYFSEIIIIDNCSVDSTPTAATKSIQSLHLRNTKIIHNKQNYGLGGSFKIAYHYAIKNNYDYIFWLHGDDQANPADFSLFFDLIKQQPFDCLLGARFAKESRRLGYSALRRWANILLNKAYSSCLSAKVYDLGSGINCYRVSSLHSANIDEWPNHIAFDANFLFFFLANKNFMTRFVPITWEARDQITNAPNLSVGIQLLSMLCRWVYTREPIQSFRWKQEYEYEIISY